MNDFNDYAKQTADQLISLSEQLAGKMETWATAFERHPDAQNVNERAGFISDQTVTSPLEVLVDIQISNESQPATLRSRAIETTADKRCNQRFNNISLGFTVDEAAAHELVAKAAAITRDDIRELLHNQATRLRTLVVSNGSGRDEQTEELLGQRYDIMGDELNNLSTETIAAIKTATDAVLPRLQQAVTKAAQA